MCCWSGARVSANTAVDILGNFCKNMRSRREGNGEILLMRAIAGCFVLMITNGPEALQ